MPLPDVIPGIVGQTLHYFVLSRSLGMLARGGGPGSEGPLMNVNYSCRRATTILAGGRPVSWFFSRVVVVVG